jgi:DNA invertase Pin-like site-specific DNA recombinase
LSALFAELIERGIGLISLREGIDLSTPAGRLMAHVLARAAQYETELRAERVLAGQAAARAQGIGLMVAAHYWHRLKEPKVKTRRFRRPRYQAISEWAPVEKGPIFTSALRLG